MVDPSSVSRIDILDESVKKAEGTCKKCLVATEIMVIC